MAEIDKKKRGRPAKNISRNKDYKFRMTEDEFDRLLSLSEKTGRSRADIMRDALLLYENSLLFSYEDEFSDYDF